MANPSSMSSVQALPAQAPNLQSSLTQWLDYMQSIHVSAIDMGLSRVLPVAEKLGVLQSAKNDAFVFTVAGTNGKGSTTAVIAQICQQAGYKTALYQSPHLLEFNERVRIDGEMASDEMLINAFYQVEAARLDCGLTLSFFEMTTLAALLIFAENNCDVWVLEVGLGGRLDVVNIIDPDLAVITNIGIDHVDWLGDNVETIGAEKAGILRDDIALIFGDTHKPQSVADKILEHHVTCYQAQTDFSYQSVDEATWQFSNAAVTLQLPKPKLSLINAANALAAVLASPLNVNIEAIATALKSVKLSGRFDERKLADRHWLFDVAHNEQGVAFLLSQLIPLWQSHQKTYPNARMKLLFSMLADKDMAKVVQALIVSQLPIAEWFIAPIDHPRAATLEQLQTVLTDQKITHVHSFADLPLATQSIIKQSHEDDLIVVCGSFHTIGEALLTLN